MMAIGSGRRALSSQSLAPRACFSRGFLYLAKRDARWPVNPKTRSYALRSKDMDEEITALFQQWLIAFEKTQSATGDEEAVAAACAL